MGPLTIAGWPLAKATGYVGTLLRSAERFGLRGQELEVFVSMASRAASQGWLFPRVFTARIVQGRLTTWRAVTTGRTEVATDECAACTLGDRELPHICQPILTGKGDALVIQYSHPVLAAFGLDAWHVAGSDEDELTHRVADLLNASGQPLETDGIDDQTLDLRTVPRDAHMVIPQAQRSPNASRTDRASSSGGPRS